MVRAASSTGHPIDVYADQYRALPGHIEPFRDKVVLSTMGGRTETRTAEQELEHILKLFNRDHIDLVRMHSHTPASPQWPDWEVLFRLKEKGYIRAVGVPIHFRPELDLVVKTFPIDLWSSVQLLPQPAIPKIPPITCVAVCSGKGDRGVNEALRERMLFLSREGRAGP